MQLAGIDRRARLLRIPCSLAPVLLPIALLFAAALPAVLPAQDFSHPDTQPAPQAALIQKANDALAAGDFRAALAVLTNLNVQSPKDPQILYDLGMTLEALEPDTPNPSNPSNASNPSTATPATSALPDQPAPTPESCYRQAIDADPAFPAAHVALGLLLARTNRSAEAHTQLALATTLPGAAPALKARAFRALARLDFNESALAGDAQQSMPANLAAASDELLAAVKLTPEQPDDILLSAQIAEASRDFPGAEQAFRRYLALPQGAGDTQATAGLVHVLLAEHHPDDAEALLTPALARHPDDPAFTAQLAQAYLDSGDPAKASQAAPLLQKLRSAHPADRDITRLLARVYVETGHPDQADPLYASLLADPAAPPDPTLLDDRAEALLRLHRPAEAEKLLKQAVANPAAFPTPTDFADAATHLAFAAAEIDDPRITLQALSLRAKVLPPSPSSLFLEATANDALHQSGRAVELYRQFLAAAGGNFPDQESQARQRLAQLAQTK
jgi:Tfp pilus assembly protein PilF